MTDTFVPSFNNKPLTSPKDFYEAQCELARLFITALNPTPEEIKDINEEIVDVGWEDLLCEPERPLDGGDICLLASLIYERRETIAEEEADAKDNENTHS